MNDLEAEPMDFKLSGENVITCEIAEDQKGEWGLYIIPENAEICITEAELRAALAAIEAAR